MDGEIATIDNAALIGFVDEIEDQFSARKVITETLGEIYERAKTAGFVPEFLRQMAKERKMEAEERTARYRILDEYRRGLGMLADTPLGEAALHRVEDDPTPPMEWPVKPFADQPVHPPRRGRPRKVLFDQQHPQGTA